MKRLGSRPYRQNRFSTTKNEGFFLSGNPIGLSVVEIDTVTTQEVTVSGIDIVDGTPLLDIKPFVPGFDSPNEVDTGWFDASQSTIQSTQADERFL